MTDDTVGLLKRENAVLADGVVGVDVLPKPCCAVMVGGIVVLRGATFCGGWPN